MTEVKLLDTQEALDRIRAAGWQGVMLWVVPGIPREYNGCLVRPNMEPEHDTNLWQHQTSANDVLPRLVKVAEDNPR